MRVGLFRMCGVGDAVQLTPLFQQIAADYPGSRIDLFTSKNAAPVLEGHPLLDRVITLPTEMLQRQGTVLGSWQVWREVRRAGSWDLFVNMESRWRNCMFFPLVRAGRSVGFLTPGWKPWRVFTRGMPTEPDNRFHHGHVSSYYLELWEHLTGFQDRGFGYDLQYLRARLNGPLPAGLRAPFLCLAPGAGNFRTPGAVKQWPAAHWLQLGRSLAEAGYSVVWLGAPEDRRFLDQAGADQVGLNLVGQLSLHDTMQAVARSQGIVANDSGLFHVALGLGVPAVGFYGPTDPAHVGPFRNQHALTLQEKLPCVPCFQNECTVRDPQLAHFQRPYCLHLLTPAAVLPKVLDFFAEKASFGPGPLIPADA